MSKQPPFSLKAFLEFCRSKPAGEYYDVQKPAQCALAEFGYPDVVAPYEHGIPQAVYGSVLSSPYYYSALASRLAKLEAE